VGWISRSWKGKLVFLHNHDEGNGIVIRDNSPQRPGHVHRYVDILWSNGMIEEEIHTSDLVVVDEK
jgi:hypothetical protein